MRDADRKCEYELRAEAEILASEDEYHAQEWPEGCPALCNRCQQRLADRCDPGHMWPADWSSGDTCYCGGQYLIRHDDGQIEVKP